MAIGAQPDDVRNMFIWQAMRMAITGFVIGLFASDAAARCMAALVYGVGPADPVVLAIVAAVLCTVTLIAAWLPAARAVRVDPGNVVRP